MVLDERSRFVSGRTGTSGRRWSLSSAMIAVICIVPLIVGAGVGVAVGWTAKSRSNTSSSSSPSTSSSNAKEKIALRFFAIGDCMLVTCNLDIIDREIIYGD